MRLICIHHKSLVELYLIGKKNCIKKHNERFSLNDNFFKTLASDKVDVNYIYNDGNTILSFIINDCHHLTKCKLQLVDALLRRGANTNTLYNNKNILMMIADPKYINGDKLQLLFLLIEHDAIYNLKDEMIYPTLDALCSFLENPIYSVLTEDICDKFLDVCYRNTSVMIVLMQYDVKKIKQLINVLNTRVETGRIQ